MDGDGAFARQTIIPDPVDQGLRRGVAVDMDKNLPAILCGIGQFGVEQFQINRRITGITLFLAMWRDGNRVFQPRRASLRRTIERQFNAANAQMPDRWIGLANPRTYRRGPVTFKRCQRHDVNRE